MHVEKIFLHQFEVKVEAPWKKNAMDRKYAKANKSENSTEMQHGARQTYEKKLAPPHFTGLLLLDHSSNQY